MLSAFRTVALVCTAFLYALLGSPGAALAFASVAVGARHLVGTRSSHRSRRYRARRLDSQRVLSALADHDAARAIATVAEATRIGRDPRVIGESLIGRIAIGIPGGDGGRGRAVDRERTRTRAAILDAAFARRRSRTRSRSSARHWSTCARPPTPASISKSRWSSSTRVASDTSLDALVDRIERLERRLERGAGPTDASPSARRLPRSRRRPRRRRLPHPPAAPSAAHALGRTARRATGCACRRSSPRGRSATAAGLQSPPQRQQCAIGPSSATSRPAPQHADARRSPTTGRRRRCTRAARVDRIGCDSGRR